MLTFQLSIEKPHLHSFLPSNDFQWRFFTLRKKENTKIFECCVKTLNATFCFMFLLEKSVYQGWAVLQILKGEWVWTHGNLFYSFWKGSNLHMPTFLLCFKHSCEKKGRKSVGCVNGGTGLPFPWSLAASGGGIWPHVCLYAGFPTMPKLTLFPSFLKFYYFYWCIIDI